MLVTANEAIWSIIQDIMTQIFSLQCKPPTKPTKSPLKIECNMQDKTRFSRCKLRYLTTELSLMPIPDSLRCLSISSQQSPEPTVKNTWNEKLCPCKSTSHSYTHVFFMFFMLCHTHLVILATFSRTPNGIVYFQFFKYHFQYLQQNHFHG
jgi:hypothetical protein